ncbi:hypothetical membrane protein [Thermoplasma acidophilum]|uniref:Hypothetical membrane protein n=1 Tax=Thermoplasma acidophilum (strain ATCC 25905 / DSM 1728 / JCM 9062 / NBRC 15155 / AMRC-C165) TaxID=273075 RepID=Q9HKI4_THEAC|nr:hypothetical protein [Thermoplasma acidophilum]MCY0852099.1 hypothetical protein [Thermoplasma acidophilum]CAC11754.1 hypothetical membrane protein [Thermoplasma acidophilum]
MNIKILAISVAIFSVIGFAITSSAATSPTPTAVTAGEYTINIFPNSVIKNISFNKTNIVNYGKVSGENLSSLPRMMDDMNQYSSIDNLSYMSTEDGTGLILATYGSSASIQLNFTGTVKALPVDTKMSNYVGLYYFNVSGYNFTIASTVSPAKSKNNYTFSVQSSIYPKVVIVAIISNNGIQNMIDHFEHRINGYKFTYNSTTGLVNGKFLNFTFYKTNQTIANYFDRLSNLTVFKNITAMAVGNQGFQFYSGMYVGNIFYDSSAYYSLMVHDNPALQSTFMLVNGTIHFNVSKGIAITERNFTFNDRFDYNAEAGNMSMAMQQDVYGGAWFVFLSAPHFYGMMTFAGARNVTVNGTQITAETNGTMIVSFVSPPGLSNGVKNFAPMTYALEHGKLGMQIAIEKVNSTLTNITLDLNTSINAVIKSASSSGVVINVNSSQSHGTVIAVYVSSSVLNASKLIVKFDGSAAVQVSASALVNETSTTTAYYNVTADGNGSLVMIYIPHFSDHTIDIEPYTSISTPISMYYYVAVIVVVVAIIAAIGYVMVRRKK